MLPVRITTLLLAISLALFGCTGSHPSNDSLLALFDEKRDIFERLVALSETHPHLKRMAHDWCSDVQDRLHFGPTAGVVSVEDWGEYRSLFYELELGDGFERDGADLYLLASTVGHGRARTIKGYAFSRQPRTRRECGAEVGSALPEIGACYTAIGDGWHLFLRRDEG